MGSCYSTEKILNAHHQHNSKPVSRTIKRNLELPNYSGLLCEKLLNSPRNLQRSKRHNFHPSRFNSNQQQNLPDQPKPKKTELIISDYSELPLINLSQSQRTNSPKSLEEYDNSSINVSDYLTINDTVINNSDNIVYTDTKAFYPFPINLLEPDEFENVRVKVYNRINLNKTNPNIIMTTSDSLQTSFELTNKYSNGTTTSSSIQNSISSDSSFTYSSPSSPQNTHPTKSSQLITSKPSSHKPSMLQQPKPTRFGFKPGIPVASSLPNPSLQKNQPQLQIKNPTTISLDSSEPVSTFNQPTKTSIFKRTESPIRSFLKPPMPSNSNTIDLTKNDKTKMTLVQQPKYNSIGIKESSSMSSICSSTSSYSNQSTSVKKSNSSEKQVKKNIKSSGLPNPKVIYKPAILSTTTKLQLQPNLNKPPSLTSANNLKRRLFNPYPNIISTTAVTVTEATVKTTSNPADVDLNSKENCMNNSTETFIKNPDENNLVNNDNNMNNHSQQSMQQLKLNGNIFNNISPASKAKVNMVNLTKTSKMPIKSANSPTTASTTVSRLPAKKTYKPTTSNLTPLQIIENRSTIEEQVATSSTVSTGKIQNYSSLKKNNLMKAEDSAYCSSTSSTVSSHDTEINRCSMSNMHCSSEKSEDVSIAVVTQASNLLTGLKIDNNLELIDDQDCQAQQLPLTTEKTLELAESSDVLLTTSNSNINSLSYRQSVSRQQSIKESIGELNQLISTEDVSRDLIKQRRTSSTSMSERERGPMFRPPSKLPPAENSEVIQLDIETYRAILQDAQQTKVILCKLFNMLSSNSSDTQLTNEKQMTSSFFGSIIQNDEKVDQTTQTD